MAKSFGHISKNYRIHPQTKETFNVSHYGCKFCGGPASWYSDHCWRCADLALEEAAREGEAAAEIVVQKFREALGLEPK